MPARDMKQYMRDYRARQRQPANPPEPEELHRGVVPDKQAVVREVELTGTIDNFRHSLDKTTTNAGPYDPPIGRMSQADRDKILRRVK